MANELTVTKEGAIALAAEKGINELLKPLQKEIHLFDSFIAGTTHLKDDSVVKELKENEALTLRRENNKFDDNAILILNEKGDKLGYIPEKDNIIFARLLDAGKMLKAKVREVSTTGSFTKVAIGIYLVDF